MTRGQVDAAVVRRHLAALRKLRRGLLGAVGMTRPLCPYPQVTRYSGMGSVHDTENFVCTDP